MVGLALALELEIGMHFLAGWTAKPKQDVIREEESGEMDAD